LSLLLAADALLTAQQPAPQPLNVTGHLTIAGRSIPYLIRHLPISSFPNLPPALASELDRRGCLIPQSYAAHSPENVVHASLESAGSSDWAVLCSAGGTVSLLVYFSSAPATVLELAAAPETERLQAHDPSGVLGFDWGIDPASPTQIQSAQTGLLHRPSLADHDAVADTLIDHRTIYHFYLKNAWIVLEMPE
jgi:hypothetical protein